MNAYTSHIKKNKKKVELITIVVSLISQKRRKPSCPWPKAIKPKVQF